MMSGFGTREVRGVRLVEDPAREPCFVCADTEAEMKQWPDMSDISRRERLHRHMNNECGALEIAAQCLADFPDAPWDLRMRLARQAADEARHSAMLYHRVKQLGGHKGEFPVNNLEWGITGTLDDLPGRLAVQNRTFEAGLIDLLGALRNTWRAAGDNTTAELLDGILADEIVHVRFANRWIKRMTVENPRVLLVVAKSIRILGNALKGLAVDGEIDKAGFIITPSIPAAVYVEGRLEAEFTEDEVKEVLRQAGFRSIIPHKLASEAS